MDIHTVEMLETLEGLAPNNVKVNGLHTWHFIVHVRFQSEERMDHVELDVG